MVNPANIYKTEAWISNVIIVLASVVFLLKFSKIKAKNYGLYMILILNLADLSFPLVSILTHFSVNTPGVANFLAACGDWMYRFSLLWSTAIAYFLFLVVKNQKVFDPKKFLNKSFLVCSSVTIIYGLISIWGCFGIQLEFDNGIILVNYPKSNVLDQILYYLVYEVFGTIIPIALTFHFYFKVYKELKVISDVDSNPKSVLWYSVIQMFCFLPGSFFDGYFMFTNQDPPFWTEFSASLCNRFWGFLNLLAYFYLRYTSEEEMEEIRQSHYNNKSMLDLDDSLLNV